MVWGRRGEEGCKSEKINFDPTCGMFRSDSTQAEIKC